MVLPYFFPPLLLFFLCSVVLLLCPAATSISLCVHSPIALLSGPDFCPSVASRALLHSVPGVQASVCPYGEMARPVHWSSTCPAVSLAWFLWHMPGAQPSVLHSCFPGLCALPAAGCCLVVTCWQQIFSLWVCG